MRTILSTRFLLFIFVSCFLNQLAFAEISKITDRIFISDLGSARHEKSLRKYDITHILDLGDGARELPLELLTEGENLSLIHLKSAGFDYLNIPLEDTPQFPIRNYFNTTNTYIRTKLDEKSTYKILVHCNEGKSRSVAIVIAYLMKEENLRYRQALNLVRRNRLKADPNFGFREQLREFDSELTFAALTEVEMDKINQLEARLDQDRPGHNTEKQEIFDSLSQNNWIVESAFKHF